MTDSGHIDEENHNPKLYNGEHFTSSVWQYLTGTEQNVKETSNQKHDQVETAEVHPLELLLVRWLLERLKCFRDFNGLEC